jgi:hypothetical protein
MTTHTLTDSAPTTAAASGGSRVTAVMKLHLVNRFSVFAIPWMILGFVLLVNLIIWWIIVSSTNDPAAVADAQDGLQYSGATFYIFVYMMVLGIQGVALTFPFALGLSVTRRDFWLGSALGFGVLAALYSAGMTALAVIERVTNGWGLGGRMFTAVYFGAADEAWWMRFLIFFVIFLFFFFVGSAIATIYLRWRVNGMLVFFAGLALVLVGLLAIVVFTDSWPAVGAWFVQNGPVGVVFWSLVPTALAALTGFVLLRRATPKN